MKARRMYFPRGVQDCPLDIYRIQESSKETQFIINHWHPQFEINYIEEGTFTLITPTAQLQLNPGDIQIIQPDEIHLFTANTDNAVRHAVIFSTELITVPKGHFFFDGFLHPLREGTLRIPQLIHPQDGCYSAVKPYLDKLMAANKMAPDFKSQAYLYTLGFCLALMPFCSIDKEEQSPSGSKGNEIIKRCHQYIGSHYMNPITLQEVADHVHLHPNYLCRLFKKHTGQTVVENINAIRVSYATQFIRNTSKTLPQIAEMCGFTSMSYFTKIFKRHAGFTPYAYSKMYKNL